VAGGLWTVALHKIFRDTSSCYYRERLKLWYRLIIIVTESKKGMSFCYNICLAHIQLIMLSSITNSQIERASYLNREGVVRLCCKDRKEARCLFRLALAALKIVSNSEADGREDVALEKTQRGDPPTPSGDGPTNSALSLLHSIRTVPQIKGGYVTACDNALIFAPQANSSNGYDYGSFGHMLLCASCVIFNIGLTFHQEAVMIMPSQTRKQSFRAQEALLAHTSEIYVQVLAMTTRQFALSNTAIRDARVEFDLLVLKSMAMNNIMAVASLQGCLMHQGARRLVVGLNELQHCVETLTMAGLDSVVFSDARTLEDIMLNILVLGNCWTAVAA
jgi:hypothetical protein